MDLTGIGSLGLYTKNLRLKTRWDLKKSGGDLNSHASLDDLLKQTPGAFQARTEEADGQGKDRLQAIIAKINAGKKLTAEEKKYLQEKDPKLYQMVREAEEEQKDYEREIRRCRTKEEADRVRTARMGRSLTRLKSVENNPVISEEKKRELYAVENYRIARLDESGKAFVKRGDYAKLPTEAETEKAEREEKEAKEARRAEKAAREADGKAGETGGDSRKESENKTESENTVQYGGKRQNPTSENTVQIYRNLAVKGENTGQNLTRQNAGQKDTGAAKTAAREIRTESVAARKVRRAKARSAYAAYGGAAEETDRLSVEARA